MNFSASTGISAVRNTHPVESEYVQKSIYGFDNMYLDIRVEADSKSRCSNV